MEKRPLYWDSVYEIVLELMDNYPNTDVEQVSIEELNRRIVNLPNFADDPELVNDGILKDILREWYEEISA